MTTQYPICLSAISIVIPFDSILITRSINIASNSIDRVYAPLKTFLTRRKNENSIT